MFLFLCACSRKQKPEAVGNIIPARSPMADSIRFQYAVYMLPVHAHDPAIVLRETLTKKYPDLKLVEEIPKEPHFMLVHAYTQKNVQQVYAPLDLRALQYFGNGISREQARALQKSREAFILEFAHPKENVWVALQNANSLVEEIARKTGGLIWDEETREIFSPDAWHRKRLASSSSTAAALDISSQTLIHAYQNGEYVRDITLGMAKVGLPDVVVEDSPWSSSGRVGHVINLFCQSMAEGAAFRNPGKFKMDLRAIKNGEVRDDQLKSLKPNATGMACLSVQPGRWEDGDPKNRLIELRFDSYPGPDIHAREESMLSFLFGWEDSVTHVRHSQELLEESRKERAKLSDLHKVFNEGLQPGEFIEVKAPFDTPDGGREWMWVEITSWKGSKIKGLLENEPFNVPTLHDGQIVEVQEEDVFDYIHQYPDEHTEGNTTDAIIEKIAEGKDENSNHPSYGEARPPGCSPD